MTSAAAEDTAENSCCEWAPAAGRHTEACGIYPRHNTRLERKLNSKRTTARGQSS